MTIQKATRSKIRLRMAIDGPTGAGKTFTALRLAFALGQRVLVIDTECRSASKYADTVVDGVKWEFDTIQLDPGQYSPASYIAAIREGEQADYDVIIVDSISHAWEGSGGVLDMVDRRAAKTGGSFGAWRDVTPEHRKFVDAMVNCSTHLIVTMRSKMDYLVERNEQTGKTEIKKVGLKPIQREGIEYEFDVVADMDIYHNCTIGKTRCSSIDGYTELKPGPELMKRISAWLNYGEAYLVNVFPNTDELIPKNPTKRAPVAYPNPAPPASQMDALANVLESKRPAPSLPDPPPVRTAELGENPPPLSEAERAAIMSVALKATEIGKLTIEQLSEYRLNSGFNSSSDMTDDCLRDLSAQLDLLFQNKIFSLKPFTGV